MVGASDWRIIRSHVLPHLVAPMIVFSTLIVAQYVLAEAGPLVPRPRHQVADGELGQPARRRAAVLHEQPRLMVWPGLAVLLTTLAFNLLGDGLRDAFDPRSRRPLSPRPNDARRTLLNAHH